MLSKVTQESEQSEAGVGKKVNPFAIDPKEVGTRIRELRMNKNMTQADLAKLVDKSRPAIAQWETGKASPDLGYLNSLAFFLDTTPAYIAFGLAKSSSDSYRVPVMDYESPSGTVVGEMSLDMAFYRSLHLAARASLRAYRLPRGEMMEGVSKGSVVIIDESDKTLIGTGEAVLIHHKVPAIAYVNVVPGINNTYMVNIGGQRFQINGGLPVIGRVVAVLKSVI